MGKKENDYSYYQYIWEKDNLYLKMEFERRGRGIRLIETDRYLVRALLKSHDLVFGRKYPVTYEIINKTEELLEVSIKGRDNKNIKFSMDQTVKVNKRKEIKGEFYLGEIDEEQNQWRTHPAVTADIYINGKKAEFKVGVNPKFPVKMKLKTPEKEITPNVKDTFYIEIKNGFKEPVALSFNLPQSQLLTFDDNEIEQNLQGRETKTLKLPVKIHEFGLFSEEIPVIITLDSESIEYSCSVAVPVRGRNKIFGGETEENWFMANGEYLVTLSKKNNDVKVRNFRISDDKTYLMFPRFGLPYTKEFARKKPERIDFHKDDNVITMEASYHSDNQKDLEFVSVLTLHSDGLLENYYRVHNHGKTLTDKEVWVNQGFFYNLSNTIMPLEGSFVRNSAGDKFIESWDTRKLDENWLFSDETVTRGISWPEKAIIKGHHWYLTAESNLGKIEAGETKKTEPLYVAIDVYRNWKDFRSMIGLKDKKDLRDKLNFELNKGNPFVNDKLQVSLKGYRKSYFSGQLTLTSEKEMYKPQTKKITVDDGKSDITYKVKLKEKPGLDVAVIDADFDSYCQKKKAVYFNYGKSKIKSEVQREEAKDIYTVDNGALTIKASPAYSGSLFSINYEGEEWLDNLFPEPGPKSWWNPWYGGIYLRPDGLRNVSLQEAKKDAEIVQVEDNFHNTWKGIKLESTIEENDKFEGLSIEQFYLLLPDLPVLMVTSKITNHVGVLYQQHNFTTQIFLKLAENLKDGWFDCWQDNQPVKYKAGVVEYEINSTQSLVFGSKEREKKLQVYSGGSDELLGITNNEITGVFVNKKLFLEDGDSKFTPPLFLIFTDERLEERALDSLSKVTLEKK